ncbi:hypothetical protein CL629_01530 [bacterium]|nr:hypothetical protein [bacterium]|tara:strand:- start:2691 stop:3260 length:570 start_codon:yes stop_codon:yes gene_type:complete
MTKIILHGGFTSEDNELNRGYYREITKDLKDGATVLAVLFAREKEEHSKLFQDEIQKLTASIDKHLDIVQASEDKFINQVKEADVIVIRGGDTSKLIKTFKQYPDFMESARDKVIGGSSAGAYLFSKYYHSASKGKVFEGLGILPIRIVCHHNSKEFKVKKSAVEQLEKYPNDLELVILKDYEWRVFEI